MKRYGILVDPNRIEGDDLGMTVKDLHYTEIPYLFYDGRTDQFVAGTFYYMNCRQEIAPTYTGRVLTYALEGAWKAYKEETGKTKKQFEEDVYYRHLAWIEEDKKWHKCGN